MLEAENEQALFADPLSVSELKRKVRSFCETHGVAKLEVFGSVARGEADPGSDIDLLITFQPEVHLGWDFFGLQDELEAILGVKADLLTRRSMEQDSNPIRRRSILGFTRDIYAA